LASDFDSILGFLEKRPDKGLDVEIVFESGESL